MLKKLLLGVGLVAVLFAAFYVTYKKGFEHGNVEATVQWQRDLNIINAQHAQQVERIKNNERELNKQLLKLKEEQFKNEKKLNDRVNTLLASLRERKARSSHARGDMPETTAIESECTGKELARPDAEFLARYAADAERLTAALNQCMQAYEAVLFSFTDSSN